METLLYIVLVAAAAIVLLGLAVQMAGAVLVSALTLGVGVREWWLNR